MVLVVRGMPGHDSGGRGVLVVLGVAQVVLKGFAGLHGALQSPFRELC